MPLRLVGYVRVSRVGGREGPSFLSPEIQRERIERVATGAGHEIVSWREDLDRPGSTIERPEFQAALADVERKEADGIAVAKLDRFARSVAGAAKALERLEAAGGILVAADLGMDTSTSSGRLMRNVLLALAEFELDRIRDSWEETRQRTIGRGVHISRVPPVGYRRREDGGLEPDPLAAPVVRDVFRRRAVGTSWEDLAAFLDESLPLEGRVWGRSSVIAIVRRRTYLGEARAGDHVNRTAHEPIVSRAEWEAAQARAPRPPRRNEPALLQGIVVCSSCGNSMTRASDGRRGYLNYNCRKRNASGVCPAPARISTRRADAFVESAYLAWAETADIVLVGEPADDSSERAVLALEAAEAELEAYRDANLITVIGREAFVAGLDQRARAVAEARGVLDESRRATVAHLPRRWELVAEWPALNVGERRMFLAAVIDRVEVSRASARGQGSRPEDRLEIFWRQA